MELPSKKDSDIERDDISLINKENQITSLQERDKAELVEDKKILFSDNNESELQENKKTVVKIKAKPALRTSKKLSLQENKKTALAKAKNTVASDDDKSELQENKKTTLRKYSKPTRKTNKGKSKNWVILIFILTLAISALFTVVSELALSNNNVYVAFLILITLLAVNILFDIIGVAAQSADIEPFISKAARKQPSAMLAVKLLKNAEKVSNFCNDVVGDVCGIVSGVAGATLIIIFASGNSSKNFVLSVVVSSVISALTVGGKAIGKKVAMDNDHEIIVTISNILSVFKKNKEKKPSGNRKSK